MILKSCSICLKLSDTLKNINCVDENNIKCITKLEKVASKQEWLEMYSICLNCEFLLDASYKFITLCDKSESIRKDFAQQELKEALISFDSNDFNEDNINTEAISENEVDKCCSEETKSQKPTVNVTFICFHCNRVFKQKHTLSQHISVKHGNICSHCNSILNTKKELKTHIKTEHPEQDLSRQNPTKFQCEVCGEYFSLLKNILEHYAILHSMDPKKVKPYSCQICDNRFISSCNLIQHKKYHEGKRTFICTFCGKSFITKRDLSGHEKVHYNQRNYKCEKCDKSFNTSQNLRTHIFVVHTDSSQWKYSCNVCSKRFALKTSFREHVKRHQGNKEYTCHICKKSFISKHELQKHVKLHSNIKPYKCTNCEKEYRDKRSVEIHLSKVHGIGTLREPIRVKKFVCHVCPSQFFDKNKLMRHIRTHTGVKPFGCHGCDKRFIDKSYLTHHLKTIHNITDPVEIREYSHFSDGYC